MSVVGQIEKHTQARIVALLRDRLHYDYLGNWIDRPDNRNVAAAFVRSWLLKQGVSELLVSRALHELEKVAGDSSKSLYDRNAEVYGLLRYGVHVKPEFGENTVTVWLIDWAQPRANHFAFADEVTVNAADAKASGKRPDIVLYVNGIALAVLELKRSTVSVAEGIRQNLDNQKKAFIEPFFSTMQWVMAGNDTEGLRYGTIQTPEKYYLKWVEEAGDFATEPTLLDRHVLQVCQPARLLELIHDFVVFDAGIKKLCRQNQYFGVKAAQDFVRRREGGVIWHTQGSGKSLTMVWLAKWILANRTGARVLIITDRTELDEQIEMVFTGVSETIYRTKSGADLIDKLNRTGTSLLCSLVHKFGGKDSDDGDDDQGAKEFIESLKRLPPDFKAKGDIHVFVDECHRTQSGDMHDAMKALLPNAVFIGFTGTPLLKADKRKSIEIFGRYIHTYKFDQAVREGVVLDLRYEARDVDQSITSQKKIDDWFEVKTKGLNDLAKAQLKQKWGTMQRVLSSKSRLQMIVADIMMDMNTKARLADGHGNAMLVAGSIYEACKYFELFDQTELKGKCAVVSSYVPKVADAKGETTGEGETDNLAKYGIYRKMLADWFNEPEETAISKSEKFELAVKKKFVEEPGQMKLLIVVDKLLTGFDAPPATYLYIDRQMRDHGLFQAIRAEESENISAFDDMSLIQLIVERGPGAVDSLPGGIRKSEQAVAETIENNVRRLIINESPVDPAYYDKMSKLLDALIEQRREGVVSYKEYLEKIAALTVQATQPGGGPGGYPAQVTSAAQRALYNNLGKSAALAMAVDASVKASLQAGWRENAMKTKRVRLAIRFVLGTDIPANQHQSTHHTDDVVSPPVLDLETETDRILALVKNQNDY